MILVNFIKDFVEDRFFEFREGSEGEAVAENDDELISVQSFLAYWVVSAVSAQSELSNEEDEVACELIESDHFVVQFQ